MPGVMNRYIKFENAGDQFLGLCGRGLSRLSKIFAVGPLHFDFSSCTKIEKEQNNATLNVWIKSRMPAAAQPSDGVFALFNMCVATLELNREFIDKNMHKDSNFRAALFMLEQAPFNEYVCMRYPWNKTSDLDDHGATWGFTAGHLGFQKGTYRGLSGHKRTLLDLK